MTTGQTPIYQQVKKSIGNGKMAFLCVNYMEDMTVRDYEHSRPLDVHRWSDHPEVNAFVDRIYKEHIHQSGTNTQIKKKHLKVVLLDLYVAWSDDPSLNIAVYIFF